MSFAYHDGAKWIGLGFAEGGSDLVVFQDALFMNFGDKLMSLDGIEQTMIEIPGVDEITYLEAANDRLYLRGIGNESCVNSETDTWVYNCQAEGSLIEFDGTSWKQASFANDTYCANSGTIEWDHHIWIIRDPDFSWRAMVGHQNRLFFTCGYTENGIFNDFSYPYEKITTLQVLNDNDLYVSGQGQTVGSVETSLMKWDGKQWYTLGEGMTGKVYTVQAYKGKLYIGGSFARSAGEPVTNFTIWDGL